jgi:hypothetical protein
MPVSENRRTRFNPAQGKSQGPIWYGFDLGARFLTLRSGSHILDTPKALWVLGHPRRGVTHVRKHFLKLIAGHDKVRHSTVTRGAFASCRLTAHFHSSSIAPNAESDG